MGNNLITKECIQIQDKVKDWKEAILISAQPLLKNGCIEERYIDAMIQTVLDLGAYIVIAPNIAMPHARSESGALRNGFSVLKINEPVYFDETEDSKATLIVPISCVDNETHMKMLQAIAMVLGEPELAEKVLKSSDVDEIYTIFQSVELLDD